jgi:hypothetical protein
MKFVEVVRKSIKEVRKSIKEEVRMSIKEVDRLVVQIYFTGSYLVALQV